MTSDTIRIDKEELSNLIRVIVREELEKVKDISQDEQDELEKLYGSSLEENDYDKDDCVRL